MRFYAGLFYALTVLFLGLSTLFFIQGNPSVAFGLLGPAAAAAVGVIAVRSKRKVG